MLKTLAIFFALVVVLHPTPTQAKAMGDSAGLATTASPSAICWDDIVASMKRPGCSDTLIFWAQQNPNDPIAKKIQAIVASEAAEQARATDQKEIEQKQEEQEKVDQKLKIKELEERVSELEARKSATSAQLQYGSGRLVPAPSAVVTKNTEQIVPAKNAEVKAVPIKKEEMKAIEHGTSTVGQNVLPMPPKKMTWWERIFSWFKK